MCEFCDKINREIIESRIMVRIQIEIPENFMNTGVTIDNHFIADTNDNGGWDTLKFPLPDGKWSIYKTEGKIITLQKEMESDKKGYHDVDEFYPDDNILSDEVDSKIKSILRKNHPTIEQHLVELAEWYETKEVGQEQYKLLIDAITDLLYDDPHHWSTRPCPTCRPISSIIKKPFGCYQYTEQKKTEKEK